MKPLEEWVASNCQKLAEEFQDHLDAYYEEFAPDSRLDLMRALMTSVRQWKEEDVPNDPNELGFLVLTRKDGEGVVVDHRIAIRVEKKTGAQFRLCIYAPKNVNIDRLEKTQFKLPAPGRKNA